MSENDCIFCRIVRGEIDAEVVHDEDEVLAFNDIRGLAPVHVLVIPKQHLSSLEEITQLPERVARRLLEVCSEVAQKLGVRDSGYAVQDQQRPRCRAGGLPPSPARPRRKDPGDAVSLAEQIQQDTKAAMKQRDRARVGALRMLGAALKNGEIEAGRPLTEEEERVVLRRQLKQREESAEAFSRAGREEQAASESAEAEIVRAVPARAPLAGRARRDSGQSHTGNRRERDERYGSCDGTGDGPVGGTRPGKGARPPGARATEMKASGYKPQASGGVKDGVVLQGKRRRRSFWDSRC